MNGSQRIVVCGASIFVAAIESGLGAMALGEVLGFNPHLPDALPRIAALEPHVVIMEAGQTGEKDDLAQTLVCLGFPVILLDEARRKIICMSGKCAPDTEIVETGMSRLTHVIKKISAGDPSPKDLDLGTNVRPSGENQGL